jgi:hypothetical protein
VGFEYNRDVTATARKSWITGDEGSGSRLHKMRVLGLE